MPASGGGFPTARGGGLGADQRLAPSTYIKFGGPQSTDRPESETQAVWEVAFPWSSLYGDCMARLLSTTIRLDQEDVRALKRARAAGYSTSELVRKGLRVVAARYYTGRRPPSTRLFESTDAKLGDESELFRDFKD